MIAILVSLFYFQERYAEDREYDDSDDDVGDDMPLKLLFHILMWLLVITNALLKAMR